jgi:hypothetical protein
LNRVTRTKLMSPKQSFMLIITWPKYRQITVLVT